MGEEGGGTAGAAPRVELAARPAARDRLKVLAVPMLALVALLGVAGWFVFGTGLRSTFHGHDGSADVATVRAALDAFPFGQQIAVRQEVDGAVFVEGHVATPVERRALAGALESTGVQARVRLWVLESMRADIKELIAAEKVDVSFDLSPKGRLALTGVVLDKARAENLVTLIRDRVFGVSGIDSGIRTGETLLADVRKLVAASQLQPWLILRLDKDLIEVDGALPSDKVDAWVGFLQSYADKFAKLIALRSFVQLQGENGKLVPAPTSALLLGGRAAGANDSTLNLAKLQNGTYSLSDVLVSTEPSMEKHVPGARTKGQDGRTLDNAPGPRGPEGAAEAQAAGAVSNRAGAPAASSPPNGGALPANKASEPAGTGIPPTATLAHVGASPATIGASPASVEASPASKTAADDLPPGDATSGAATALGDRAAALLRRFKDGTLSSDPSAADLYRSLVLIGGDDRASGERGAGLPDWYLPLLTGTRGGGGDRPCWPGSQIDAGAILPSLFWLDLLSASRSLSLASLPRGQQLVLLEAALDPAGVAACARRSPDASRAAEHSLYLREVRRNPGFVRFLGRDLPGFSLDVAGVSLGTDRFVVSPSGDRMFEGTAPDRGTRLALIGELGLVVQSTAALSVVVFGPNIDWVVSD